MSNNNWIKSGGGLAAAVAAHAAFAWALVAGQPQPELYLARLGAPLPQTLQAPPWQLATRPAHDAAQMPVTQTLTPERLHKGLSTC